MHLQENLIFNNRYRLLRQLGRGGFSEVWLAKDTVTGVKVALKVYAPGQGLDDDGVKVFTQEFALVFDFNHSHLLKPSYYDVCDRMPYLIMPYCEHGSATKLTGRIHEAEAWTFLHDAAAGLAYLHGQEPPVIHQDIKPDNVLKDAKGAFLITDFGISTKARSTLRKSVVQQQSSGGTIAYMPPERFGRDNTPIKASDVWSLGATVFELLTGNVPFGEHGGLIQKSGAEIPRIDGAWSAELTEITERCLALNTWDRPTAAQMVAWTEQRARGEQISFGTARQEEITERKTERRTEPRVIPVPEPDVYSESPAAPSPKLKKNIALIVGLAIAVVVALLVVFYQTGKEKSPIDHTQSSYIDTIPEVEMKPDTIMSDVVVKPNAAADQKITDRKNVTEPEKTAVQQPNRQQQSEPHEKENITFNTEEVTVLYNGTVKPYCVVVANLQDKLHSLALKIDFDELGYTACVVQNEYGMYRVIAASFDNPESAIKECKDIRKKYPDFRDAWVLNADIIGFRDK